MKQKNITESKHIKKRYFARMGGYYTYLFLGSTIFLGVLLKLISPAIVKKIIELCDFEIVSMAIYNATDEKVELKTYFKVRSPVPLQSTISFVDLVRFGFVQNASEQEKSEEEIRFFGFGKIEDMTLLPNISNDIRQNITLTIENNILFGRFAKQLLNEAKGHIVMHGQINVRMYGVTVVKNVSFSKKTQVEGMMGLKNLKITNIHVEEGTQQYIKLLVDSTLYNPSNIEIEMGDVNLNLSYKNELMGIIKIKNMRLEHGQNKLLKSETIFNPSAKYPNALLMSRYLLTNFCNGNKSKVVISGDRKDVAFPSYWYEAFKALKINSYMPGIETKLIEKCTMKIANVLPKLVTTFATKATCTVTIKNPFKECIFLKSIVGSAKVEDDEIGTLDTKFEDFTTTRINGYESREIDHMDLKLNRHSYKVLSSGESVTDILIDVDCTICALVGSYPIIIDYKQEKVQVNIQLN